MTTVSWLSWNHSWVKTETVQPITFSSDFYFPKSWKKNISLVETINNVRRELPASAKCLRQRSFGKFMKACDMATLTVHQGKPRKTFVFLVFCICLLSLANLRKRNRRQWNFITRSNVVLTCWRGWLNGQAVFSQSRYPSVARCCFLQHFEFGGVNAFVLYKKRTGDKVSRRGFMFKLATELREDYIVERSNRNSLTIGSS